MLSWKKTMQMRIKLVKTISNANLQPFFAPYQNHVLLPRLQAMSAYKALVLTSLSRLEATARFHFSAPFSTLSLPCRTRFSPSFLLSPAPGLRTELSKASSCRCYSSMSGAIAFENADSTDELNSFSEDVKLETPEDSCTDGVEKLLSKGGGNYDDDVSRFMKMERSLGVEALQGSNRWFPYLDKFKVGNGVYVNCGEVLEALNPYIMDTRKERFRKAVKNRSYSVCLVVEGLCDFGNVSAAFRSADALGFQSVHVVSCDSSKRYRDNRHVSMGAEKWLDIELWDSTKDCFQVLKSRGYRIATTHLGTDAVSIYDMDWSCPTAIVVGNENRGISNEALELSDLHCSIPMQGMVDSFNVSVAAGILMHHAVCDRTSRMGSHGDLTTKQSQILLAEFFLRHSKSTIDIVNEYAKRNLSQPLSKL